MPEPGKRVDKLYAKEAHIPGRFLAQDFGRDGRGFVGYQARGRGRRCGNGELDKLFGLKDMRRSNACAGRANIKGLGELDEFDSHGIGTP